LTWGGAEGIEPLTPCMPCSFGPLPHPRSAACTQPTGLLEVTVTVRWIPLVTAACGTWVARPARTTFLERGGNGSQHGQGVRPDLGNHCIVGKSPEGSRQPGGEIRLWPASWNNARSGTPPALSPPRPGTGSAGHGEADLLEVDSNIHVPL
jgi:hypothetical protein